jgi:acyl-CoA reductase-like NAD-dependent aldehyde dehydrogenase
MIETRNPAQPHERVAEAPTLSWHQLDRAVHTTGKRLAEWSSLASARADALNQWAAQIGANLEPLALLVAREVGKPIQEARAEVARGVAILRYYAQAAFDPSGDLYPSPDGKSMLMAERLPLGIVMTVTPFNFPVAIPAWKIGPALAYGNAVIFKPSSAAVGTATRLVELAHPAVPKDILVLATTGSDVAQRLVDDERIAGVSFTGSAAVGRALIERIARRGGAVQAEMGGQNPSIILDDADVPLAAKTIASAAMGYAGQKCTATRRVVVTRSIAASFVPALVEATRALAVGDPLAEETVVGPVISEAAREDVGDAIREAVRRGARVLAGGDTPNADGWFYRPTLLQIADPADAFTQEEVFGPAATILVAKDENAAVEIANGTRYGLSAAVFSKDTERATLLARRLRAGLIRVNASTTGVDFYAPFGGERLSSFGPREQGRAAREFYTRSRTLLINRT